MLILALDPGYANLGIAVVELDEDNKGLNTIVKIHHSETIRVGCASRPLKFAEKLWHRLEGLGESFDFDAVAFETPTFIMRQIRTTALLWHTMGIVTSWATHHGLPVRSQAPITLKRTACFLLQRKYDKGNLPDKKEVGHALKELGVVSRSTDHENDAILAAFSCYGYK